MIRSLSWLRWGIYATSGLILLDGLALVYYWGMLEYNLRGLCMFYGFPLLVGALIAFIVGYIQIRSRCLYGGRMHCRRCGYLLRELKEARCHECGTSFTP